MESLPQTLKDMYRRERAMLPSDDEFENKHINYTDVLRGYYFLVDYFQSLDSGEKFLAGLKDHNLLASALSRQVVGFGGKQKWTDPMDIAATLFYGIAKDHAFHDGNKRIALLMLLKSLLKANRVVDCPPKEFEQLTVAVAANSLLKDYGKIYNQFLKGNDPEVMFVSNFIRRKTRKLETQYRAITFRELKSVLQDHNCDIDDPYHNSISVFQDKEVSAWLGFRKRTERVKVGTIGFPSWTKQVSEKDISQVRKITGLTKENGIDSIVFYGGGEPVYKLIEQFEKPLIRLKDK